MKRRLFFLDYLLIHQLSRIDILCTMDIKNLSGKIQIAYQILTDPHFMSRMMGLRQFLTSPHFDESHNGFATALTLCIYYHT